MINNKKIRKINEGNLEYALAGEHSPTVLFLNGGGPANMDSWSKVYPQLAKKCRVFAYNRFGDGNSDQINEPQTGLRVIVALKQLLEPESLVAPYILVGHSMGGLYAILFARLYPQLVAGVVLVDSAHPDQGKMMREQGFLNRLILKIFAKINPAKASELDMFDVTAQQIKDAGIFPDVPLTVITAGKRSGLFVTKKVIEVIERHQVELVGLSAKGKQIVASKSGHFVQNSEPGLVVTAISEIIDIVKV